MPWKPRVEGLRADVLQECKDVPPDLILAIINNESGGQAGIAGRVKTKSKHDLPTASGGSHFTERAYGLTQAIPGTILGYNRSQKNPKYKATFEDVSGTDERARRIQIRIGCWLLALINKFLHNKFSSAAPAQTLAEAKPDQIKLVLTGYAVGHGNTEKKMSALQSKGITPTFSAIEKAFPDWGKSKSGDWINRPIFYANKVGTNYESNRGNSFVEPGAGSKITNRITKMASNNGLMWLGVAAILATAYFKGRKSE